MEGQKKNLEIIIKIFQRKNVNFEEQFTVDKMRELFKLKDHDDNGFIAKGDVRVLMHSLGQKAIDPK